MQDFWADFRSISCLSVLGLSNYIYDQTRCFSPEVRLIRLSIYSVFALIYCVFFRFEFERRCPIRDIDTLITYCCFLIFTSLFYILLYTLFIISINSSG